MPAANSRPRRPDARIVQAPAYHPDLEAYGLKLDAGQIVPLVECPDRPPAEILADPRATIDARLWEGKFDRNGRLQESRVTNRLTKTAIEQRYTRLREATRLTEDDWFAVGGYPAINESPLTSNYVPMIPGPATRQQYWADYWMSSAKCFEASTHSGVARRACKAMVNFPLARGVQWRIKDDRARDTWEQFWNGNKMGARFRSIAYDLSVFGEQFLRYFPARRGDPRGLIIRQLDPATIYEIVTDQEDLETVFFYHQQFQTRMELYSPPASSRAPEGRTKPGTTRYIIRQIDASEIDHYRIHTVSGEARGRSDLFPVLGDLKRMRDLLTSKVVQSDLGNRVMAILSAKGTGADLDRILNTIFPGGQPPAPGTIVALNEATSLDPFQYSNGREVREDFTYEELVDSIVAGTGISRADLGLSPAGGSGTTQATALTAETGTGKAYEERQLLLDEMLHEMFDRVMARAGINGEVDREFIFPELVKEDRSAKLEDLEQAEANTWISHETAATAAAAELGLTHYEYQSEMQSIVREFADAAETDGTDQHTGREKPAQGGKLRRPMLRAAARQAPKLDPTRAIGDEDVPPGVIVDPDGKPAETSQAPQKTAGGLPADKTPAARSNSIRESDEARLRRTPEDPEFVAHADEFTRETAENLKQLIADLAA